MGEHQQVWNLCLATIQAEVNPQSYSTWFKPIRPVRLKESVLTIQVPNKFFYEWLEQHYVDLLKKVIRKELGDKAKLEYQILMQTADEPQQKQKNGVHEETKQNEQNEIRNPFVIPGIRKMKVETQLNKNCTFDNYIEGDCNRLARSAGLAIAERSGTTSFNPLVIYGSAGLGKTHLAQAIGNTIVQNHPEKSVLYISIEKFSNQMVQAIKNNTINDFVSFYQLLDVLIVDDIHFLAERTKTQEIFFHIFNQLHQNRKQLIITSDRAPKDLNGMDDRLISRFKWGLTADLQIPDLETRMAILEAKMEKEGIILPPNIVEFISYHIKDNIRELEGVLISLIAQSSLNRKEVDLTLAKEVIQKFVTQLNSGVSIESIQELVAKTFDIPVDQLNGKSRKRGVVIARQLSMYLAKNYTNKSLKVIGDYFGGKDHSTVIYSCKAIQDMLDTDPKFRTKVNEIEREVKISLNATG
ncbi:MAG: chromosomal replication initiator protein DnaA [Saprospiraceae bacterium]|nr:chromosomal replication initiator protein DnaA [Saprospiraceae bacterium]